MTNWISQLAKEHAILLAILIAGLALRIYGIYFDYPGVNFIWDEHYHISYILKVADAKSLATDVLQHPILLTLFYIPAVVLKVGYTALTQNLLSAEAIKTHYILSGMGELIIVTRWFSVAFGMLGVYLIYKIYRLLFAQTASAYAAAAAYAVSVLPVFLSHWGKAHSGMITFYLLSLFFILIFERKKDFRFFYLSVFAATLALSVHYVGISAFIIPVFGVMFNKELFRKKEILRATLLYALPVSFFYLMNFNGVRRMVLENLYGYYAANNYVSFYPVGKFERFYFVFRDTFFIEPVLMAVFWLAVALFASSLVRDKLHRYVFGALAFNYLIMVSIISAPRMTRWLLPFLTLAATFGIAYAVDRLTGKNCKRTALGIFIGLLLIPSLSTSMKWVSLLRANTFLETKQWLSDNLHGKEVVYSFEHRFDAPLSYEAARYHKEVNKQNESAKINYIVTKKDVFDGTGMNLFYDFYNYRYEELGGSNTKYILIAYWKKEKGDTIRAGVEKFHRIKLVQSFYPTHDEALRGGGIDDYLNNPTQWTVLWKLDKSGPFVEIYEVL
ncbi:MAG: hypothetical protein A3H69_04960 [Candidatus Sungbacteria bacterium RIFCSPLOWO2_02_FULL_47_9]|uniref:Glycosyltransferase RgtA/B/C/D-like domain-containing protein n=1 Tax=Candidatus Sungbacteria bacterium RIFCSPHIGHO2_01_FULL_47_32 TaxID=1802264 RepID=A0A1G2K5E0_9BACT|nr:MAG: hypothetical protein UX72_C0006G0019 [Parcubacteria group bacterium GW2011_GWA2_47_10]OGZ94659.1 MAG: hypothetical protein A2633_01420 [Candidatus Sungbacteria bacterium RIFCSPHIGHO2_01_FULL_47_32]OGZ98167.1 MAG: hypothetical protein A3D57_03055 [Candidatus Sungbacteria bacterium RIFCSPHIGHO2_02_FULL_46_12]OHA04811.1 MAG: hypothetical protein A3A28_04885 [Candidatus Sungbacteria bacterium RIFCSPLOWO2_01_FULL_47_32]OHA11980.1 MAG: hypothetical protein A3H69_04960 [Candidatus Sungbacteria